MAINSYQEFTTSSIPVHAGQWNVVHIPVGAIDAMISLENNTMSFRVASSAGGPTAGAYVPAQGSYVLQGACAKETNVYVYPAGETNVILQIQV